MSKFKYYLEKIKLKKNEWKTVKMTDLDKELVDKLWEMYLTTYGELDIISHKNVNSIMTGSHKLLMLVDVDEDPLPDAFIVYKEKGNIKKMSLGGTDGSKKAKRSFIDKLVELYKSGGFVGELSTNKAKKLYYILTSHGVPVIKDEKLIKKVIDLEKGFENLQENGEYTRRNKAGVKMTKILLGKLK